MRSRIESIGVSMPGGRLFTLGSVDHAVAAGKRCLDDSRAVAEVRQLINAGMFHDHCGSRPWPRSYRKARHQPGVRTTTSFSFDLTNGGVGCSPLGARRAREVGHDPGGNGRVERR